MISSFTVDFISDLNLQEDTVFDWTEKATSLFCIVAGGISNNIDKVKETLEHLSKHYRGVFYIDGALEHEIISDYNNTIDKLKEICDEINNVVFLHNHVVVLNGVAFLACNGWFKSHANILNLDDHSIIHELKIEDIAYLTKTIKTLQSHKETKKIVVISGSVPSKEFLYQKDDDHFEKVEPGLALMADSEIKVKNWVFGGSEIVVDVSINNRRFVNNPYIFGQPYWPKRVEV